MENTNEMQLIFDSRSSNESFARVTVAAFMTVSYTHLDVYKRQHTGSRMVLDGPGVVPVKE